MDGKNENRLVEFMAEMLIEMREFKSEMRELKNEQKETSRRLDKLEEQQEKTNLAIGELRFSVIRLAENMELVFQHEKRIGAL